MLLPSCFLTAFVRLPTSVPPFHLAVARYAFAEHHHKGDCGCEKK
ncbi:hypothetical protein [Prevotella falsenii]|nr:hypothetical protein [Prevotella falsenii]